MAATADDIRGWLKVLYEDDGFSHMAIFCDTYDWDDYPVYIEKGTDPQAYVQKYMEDHEMQRLMEVYSRNHTLEEQMGERRAFHYD